MNNAMVRAILAGQKVQTRRVAKGVVAVHARTGEALADIDSAGPRVCCPFGGPGDRLWVRERFKPVASGQVKNGYGEIRYGYAYEADALAEGIDHGAMNGYARAGMHRSAGFAFRDLWTSTGGDWDSNPWVWVIDFKLLPA